MKKKTLDPKEQEQRDFPRKKYLALSIGCFFLFFLVLILVKTHRGDSFDQEILAWIISLRTPGLNTLMEAVTYLGNWEAIAVLCLFLWANQSLRRSYAFPVTMMAGVTVILKFLIKSAVARPRPDAADFLIEQGGTSFPSGHALTAMAVFFLLYLLIKRDKIWEKKRRPLMAVALILAFFIGLSRIYVGVHYPLDVLSGWLLAWGLVSLFFIGEHDWGRGRKKGS